MRSVASLLVPTRRAALLATVNAAVDGRGVVIVTLITFGGVNLDLLESRMHDRLIWSRHGPCRCWIVTKWSG